MHDSGHVLIPVPIPIPAFLRFLIPVPIPIPAKFDFLGSDSDSGSSSKHSDSGIDSDSGIGIVHHWFSITDNPESLSENTGTHPINAQCRAMPIKILEFIRNTSQFPGKSIIGLWSVLGSIGHWPRESWQKWGFTQRTVKGQFFFLGPRRNKLQKGDLELPFVRQSIPSDNHGWGGAH